MAQEWISEAAQISDCLPPAASEANGNQYGFRAGQNAWLRRETAPIVYPISRALHRKAPWLKPWMISVAGFIFYAAGVHITEKGFKDKSLKMVLRGTGLKLAGGACDYGDGVHARANGMETDWGNWLDALIDRGEETLDGLYGTERALRNRDFIGASIAWAKIGFEHWSSLAKAALEMYGKKEPSELGDKPSHLLGSRSRRFCAKLASPYVYHTPVVGPFFNGALDVALGASTVDVAISRIKAIDDDNYPLAPEDKQQHQIDLATTRYGVLKKSLAGSIAASVLVPLAIRRNQLFK